MSDETGYPSGSHKDLSVRYGNYSALRGRTRRVVSVWEPWMDNPLPCPQCGCGWADGLLACPSCGLTVEQVAEGLAT